MSGRATGGEARLRDLMARGSRFLGVENAIMCGAMTWVSERRLVAAIADAGGFGVLACGGMNAEQLSAEIAGAQALTDRPFGVNLVVMHPALDQLLDVCLDHRVSQIVLAGGMPTKAQIEKAGSAGAKVVGFAPSLVVGKRLLRHGVDALVIEGMEAGGHIGPVSTNVLAQEILPHIQDAPVFVAGGVGHGEAIASYLRMGAAGVQIGTMFVVADESIAHPDFKKAFVRANARDAQASVAVDPKFKVIPVRALANAATERFHATQIDVIARHRRGELSFEEAQLEIERFWVGALRRAVVDGDVANGSMMAGQSVGMIGAIRPAQAIMDDLLEQAAAALSREGGEGRSVS